MSAGPARPDRYYLVGARPTKVVTPPGGGMDCLAFDWATGGFVRHLDYLPRILGGDPEIDELDEVAFTREVNRIRRERGLPNP